MNMVNWENRLYAHRYFARGAAGLLRSYMSMAELSAKAAKSPEETKEMETIDVKAPLEEAAKFAVKALKFHSENVELHQLAARVYILQGNFTMRDVAIIEKWDLAVKSLLFIKAQKAEEKELVDMYFDKCIPDETMSHE